MGPVAVSLRARIERNRSSDGGFAPAPGGAAEPEPTAMAALALDDDGARRWLAAHQRRDGSWGIDVGPTVNVGATALAALALGQGPQAERALRRTAAHHAATIGVNDEIPVNPAAPGWGWTDESFGWVDPTARLLLATRRLRPGDRATIEAAVALLADRECVGGGWNYGNRTVLGTDLSPYVHTTAMALLALAGLTHPMVERGLAWLRSNWMHEPGGLSLALSALVLDDGTIRNALADRFAITGFLDDTVALAWALLAVERRSVGAAA